MFFFESFLESDVLTLDELCLFIESKTFDKEDPRQNIILE